MVLSPKTQVAAGIAGYVRATLYRPAVAPHRLHRLTAPSQQPPWPPRRRQTVSLRPKQHPARIGQSPDSCNKSDAT